RHVAESRGLAFDVDVAPGLPTLRTDSKRLQQVLKNLLSNAFKFTHQGEVALRMRPAAGDAESIAGPSDGPSPVVAIDVEDTGIGIDEHQHEVIFEGFKQADGTTSRTYGGTGLGLSISRNLIRLLGGRITLRSRPGEGSCFTVLLPAATPFEIQQPADAPVPTVSEDAEPIPPDSAGESGAPVRRATDAPSGSSRSAVRPEPEAELDRAGSGEPSAEPSGSNRADGALLQGRSVLVVDDDARSVFALAALLETRGASVDVAQSGEEALQRLRSGPAVDLMLLDIMMPRKDGYETLRELRSLPGLARLPVIAVTARAMPGDRDHSLEAGATEYIAKPVRPDELVAMARRLMGTQ
ncbi:MAG: response regulator, partial [Candidatus Dormibacteraeota bacterium]|nr:response regulator [Candidatus Dormibacteraeota bacterium]